ncbi:MAG TPA: M20 family metallopeptidase [Candidatus Saccharimonadales bacterium]|nr:M20 family metallopeptidase [Candidatus Saccharimonadales bacterium]
MDLEKKLRKQLITWKNDLEHIAELGWTEVKTTEYIKNCIGQPSLVDGLGENKTGAAFILGNGKEKIFFRADIDGLPVKNGVKHICGHSAHMAGLLGAFHYVKSKENELSKNNKQILFIFQPAEETFPSGAKAFIDTYPKLFTDCQYGFGVHDDPGLPLHTIELKDGIRCAAGDYVEIEILGKSIHVEHTPKGIDAIYGASLIVQAVKDFQKTFSNFGKTLVFNINTIQGGTAPNIIAGNTKMTGDIRWFSKEDQKKVKLFFKQLPKHINSSFGGEIIVTYYDGYPPVRNDSQLTSIITDVVKEKKTFSLIDRQVNSLGIEDFCFYGDIVPCIFTDIGVGGDHLLHEENFQVSDAGTLAIFDYWKLVIDWWLQNKQDKSSKSYS